ncbi:MAG: YbaK/EbsC family protein [Leptolyngbya sp. IPPAS B-1204]
MDSISTYPMIMALLPNNLLENEFAHAAFVAADKTLAENKAGQNGYYVIVTAHKPPQATSGYSNVERILQDLNAEYEVLEHQPVLSMEDVKREVGPLTKCIIKTLLIRHKDTEEFVAVLLQSEKRLDINRVADLLDVNRYHIHFAREKEILQLGFPLGGIAPFGFEASNTVHKYVDSAIISHRCKWLYTGSGDNRKTLKIRKQDFLRIIADYQRVDF